MSKQLEDEVAALKAATREAHETIQGLREACKEAEGWFVKLKGIARTEVDDVLKPVVEEKVEELGVATKEAISQAVDRVNTQFDELASILLGEDKKSVRTGKPSLKQIIERKVENEQAP